MQRSYEPTTKQVFLNRLSEFLIHNRVWLLGLLISLAAFVGIYAIVTEVRKNRIESSTILVENVQELVSEWRGEEDEEIAGELAEQMFANIETIITDYPNLYAGLRALFLRGSLYYDLEEFELAAEDFAEVAERFSKSYLAPVALVNAAVAMEEDDSPQIALRYYNQVLEEYSDVYPGIAAVLFDLGRISEGLDNVEDAMLYYNQIVDEYTSSSWTNLARNRIIHLNASR